MVTALNLLCIEFSRASAQPDIKVQVYIGAVSGLDQLADAALAKTLLQSGRIGLYEHAVGMSALFMHDRTAWQRLLDLWDPMHRPAMAEEGEIPSLDPMVVGDAFAFFSSDRRLPAQAVINVRLGQGMHAGQLDEAVPGKRYHNYADQKDLASYKAAIANLRQVGASTLYINYTPNYPLADIDDPFPASKYWAFVRDAYVAAGGGALDTPPTYFMQDTPSNPYVGEKYRRNIAQQIQWLNGRGLGSVVILSPCGPTDAKGNHCGDAFDPDFLANTQREVAYLSAFGQHSRAGSALPTAWVVENYSDVPGNTANRPSGAQGLAEIALWLEHNVNAPPRRHTQF